jgi:hypothetical protein
MFSWQGHHPNADGRCSPACVLSMTIMIHLCAARSRPSAPSYPAAGMAGKGKEANPLAHVLQAVGEELDLVQYNTWNVIVPEGTFLTRVSRRRRHRAWPAGQPQRGPMERQARGMYACASRVAAQHAVQGYPLLRAERPVKCSGDQECPSPHGHSTAMPPPAAPVHSHPPGGKRQFLRSSGPSERPGGEAGMGQAAGGDAAAGQGSGHAPTDSVQVGVQGHARRWTAAAARALT